MMYLNTLTDVVIAHLPCLVSSSTQDILGTCDVNGAAIDASASDNETPTYHQSKHTFNLN